MADVAILEVVPRKEYYRKWASKNRDKVRAAQKRYREKHTEAERTRCREKAVTYRTTVHGRADRLLSAAKRRASTIGVAFDLDLEWLKAKLEAGVCEVTRLPFILQAGRSLFAPSLDRQDPNLGYTKDNVRVTLWCYNAAKGVGTDEEVMLMAKALVHRD